MLARRKTVKVTRVYTGEDNESHFEDLDVPLKPARYGQLSELVEAAGVIFRETPVGGAVDFHTAPRRQFVVNLSGLVEVECGDGTKRRLGPGDILLADDTTGHGHITRDIEGPRRSLFIPLPDSLDTAAWRV
jgi:quercetin dioxygenase-like cupin family protein